MRAEVLDTTVEDELWDFAYSDPRHDENSS
jgi:hypothetical protein